MILRNYLKFYITKNQLFYNPIILLEKSKIKKYVAFVPCLQCSMNSIKPKKPLILGIESSCDDTGAAILDGDGTVIGEGFASQVETTVKFGGVIPSIARKLHIKNIKNVVDDAFLQANIHPKELTAVASTIKPGQHSSLSVGRNMGVELALKYNLPFIPIHHMEAHALTARMMHEIEFPFVCILLSGGHSLIVLAEALDKWSIVGESIDSAVGVSFDKLARRLKLRNLPEVRNMCSGAAIEKLSKEGDSKRYTFNSPLSNYRSANFCFGTIGTQFLKLVISLEKEQEIEGGRVLPEVKDLCASFQYCVTKHLLRKLQYAFYYLEYKDLIPDDYKTVVMSGGVASNQYIRENLELLCTNQGYRLFIPPPKLCTDNGVMIAWNAYERWNKDLGVLRDPALIQDVQIQVECPIGPSLVQDQLTLNLQHPPWYKF